MAAFYTRKGDDGSTGLLGPGRIEKSDLRIEAIGAVDEASAALGLARSICRGDGGALILQVQRDLYGLMAEVAATPENAARFRVINAERIAWLEAQIDQISAEIKLPGEFIIPGDIPAGGALDLARAVVRRAERRLVELAQRGDIQNPELLRYLNRLSSFCYVLELYEIQTGANNSLTLAKG
jgi:cob(I)alamin adenosyltransferase